MKLTFYGIFLQCLILNFLFASEINAQEQSSVKDVFISLKLKDASLNDAFRQIEKQTDFVFSYDLRHLEGKLPLNIDARNRSVAEILLEISEQAGLKFKQVNNNINVEKLTNKDRKAEKLEIIIQTRTITGKVTSMEDNEGLPGVNVVEKGTSNGTVTDVQGNYSLEVAEGATLVFSSVGYTQEELEVGNRSTINLAMKQDVQQLQELVVVGYGSQKKSELTVAVSQVNAAELKDIPVSSIDQALVGRAAGVSVVQGSGAPGSNTSIRIRGSNSINSSSEPLYVVDGLIIGTNSGDNTAGSRFQLTGDQINILATINPSDIESIDVLKDASATAIYGARGANGVILITTKKGSTGGSSVSVSAYEGVQNISNSIDMLNSTELSQLIYDARINSGLAVTNNPDLLNREMAIPDTYNTDWLSQVTRTAAIRDYNVSLKGGGDNGRYLLSMGYFGQDGVVKATDLERFSARVNVESSAINNRINIGANLSGTNTNSQMISTRNIYQYALLAAPNLPVYNDEGFYTYNVPENFYEDGFNYPNVLFDYRGYTRVPMYNIEMVQAPKNSYKIFGNAFLDVDIIKGLTYKLNAGVDINQNKIKYFAPEFGDMREGEGAVNDLNHVFNSTLTLENTLNYNKSFGKHHINVLVGQSQQEYKYERLGFTATNLANFYTFWGDPDNGWAMAGDLFATASKYSEFSDWSFNSYFGRFNYNYNDRYLLTATIRKDGSSKFGANNKWGTFPGVSAAWILSNESFLNNLDVFNSLKVRAGYGVTGNSNISNYLSLFVMTNLGSPIGGFYQDAFAPRRLVDKDLSWESTGQFNIGLDASMFDDRLNYTIDIYTKHTWDMIDALEVSTATGFNNIAATNIGELKGSGIELSLAFDVIKNNAFLWNSRLIMSREVTKITKLADEKEYFGNSDGDIRSYLNRPIGEFYGFKVLGLWQQGEDIASSAQPNASPGDYKYLDWNGYDENGEFTNEPDGQLNDADRISLGNALPDLNISWTNTFNYKNFDLTAFIVGVTGISVYNQARWTLLSLNGVWNNTSEALNRWTPDNTNTNIQRAAETRLNGLDGQLNSEFIEDASYLRLSNLALGYTFRPSNNLLRSLRVYVSAQNLITLTNYSGADPEVTGAGLVNRGIDNNSYPRTKVFLMGLNVNF